MRDVTTLNDIAKEIKDQANSCMLLSKQIIQMSEVFDLDGIQKLADALDAAWLSETLDCATKSTIIPDFG